MQSLRAWLSGLPSGLHRRGELRPLLFHLGLDDGADARAAYYQTLTRNLRMLARLDEILDRAEAEGLRLLPYKGAALAATVYPDVGTRPMADLDLLVEPSQLTPATALLKQLGFSEARPDVRRFSPRHAHDVALSDGVVYVELHYGLFHELELDGAPGPIFDRAVSAQLGERSRLVPSVEDHVAILALHAATHAYADSPLWLVDLALLLEGADRAAAAAEASRRHGARAFALALQLFEHPTLAALWMSTPPGRLRSLLTRAGLVEGALPTARWLGRKLLLTAHELWER